MSEMVDALADIAPGIGPLMSRLRAAQKVLEDDGYSGYASDVAEAIERLGKVAQLYTAALTEEGAINGSA